MINSSHKPLDMDSAKDKVGRVAQAMLDGNMHYLLGAEELVELRESVGAYVNDPDFFPFVAVVTEIQNLSMNKFGCKPSKLWSKTDHTRHRKDIQASVVWAKDISLHHCEALAQRYASGD